MTPIDTRVFRSVGQRSVSKVKPFLYMLGKGGISVLQTAIFAYKLAKKVFQNSLISLILTFNICEIHKNDLIKLKFSENVFYIHYSYFCKRPVVLPLFKTHIFIQKCKKKNVIMCSFNVFTIIVWDFIKFARKTSKVTTFFPRYTRYPHEKSVFSTVVTFAKLGCYSID